LLYELLILKEDICEFCEESFYYRSFFTFSCWFFWKNAL